MKKKVMRLLMVMILIIPTIIIGFSYFDYRSYNITDTCIEEVELYLRDIKHQTGKITLEKYLDFKSDGYFIIGPYITSQERQKIVGEKWYNASSYASHIINEKIFKGDNINESQQIFVFVKDGTPISFAITDRSEGDLLNDTDPYYSIDDILINCKESRDLEYWRVSRLIKEE